MRTGWEWATVRRAALAGVAAVAVSAVGPALAHATEPLPSIESESVSHVSSSDATLEAQVNLEGVPNGVYYQFQVVRDPSEYASGFTCLTTRPQSPGGCPLPQEPGGIPIGFLPGNTEKISPIMPASLDLASVGVTLEPDTIYHYRVIVARRIPTEDTIQWEEPIVYGLDQTFTTLPAGAKRPTIESESLSHLTSTDATLQATLDTEGLETRYRFQMWFSPCSSHGSGCEDFISVPLPSGMLLGSFIPQSVSLDLASAGVHLYPGHEYEWSLIATNAAGTAEGEWHTFIVPEEGVAPLDSAPSGGGTGGSDLGGGGSGSTGGAPQEAPQLISSGHHHSGHARHHHHRRHRHRKHRHHH